MTSTRADIGGGISFHPNEETYNSKCELSPQEKLLNLNTQRMPLKAHYQKTKGGGS